MSPALQTVLNIQVSQNREMGGGDTLKDPGDMMYGDCAGALTRQYLGDML